MRYYVNGQLKRTQNVTTDFLSNTNNLLIGGIGVSTSSYEGFIDDVRIFDYARSISEIRLDYNDGFAARFGGSPAKDINRGLVGYWDFNEGNGTTANDSSDSNNDGTLTLMDSPTDWVAGKAGNGGALDFDGVVKKVAEVHPTFRTPAIAITL